MTSEQFRIVGALQLTGFSPSFALAIVASPTLPGYWLQVMSPTTQRVQAFLPLAENEWVDVQIVADRPIRIGDEYIHAFIDRSGGLYLDTSAELRVLFNIALADPNTSSAMKLAISEQMADAATSRKYRRLLVEAVAEKFGGYAARSLENSAVRSALWTLVESSAIDAVALRRIQAARSRILAEILPDGTMKLDLSAINPEDLKLTLDEISRILLNEFGLLLGELQMPRADLSGLPHAGDPTAVTILEAVRRSPRQEERLAILIRALILHPQPAMTALEIYHEPAQMARNTIKMLQQYLPIHPKINLEEDHEGAIASIIPRIISDAYPRRRGAILFYFATHLSDFPRIASQIRTILGASHSMAVEELRVRIEKALADENIVGRPG